MRRRWGGWMLLQRRRFEMVLSGGQLPVTVSSFTIGWDARHEYCLMRRSRKRRVDTLVQRENLESLSQVTPKDNFPTGTMGLTKWTAADATFEIFLWSLDPVMTMRVAKDEKRRNERRGIVFTKWTQMLLHSNNPFSPLPILLFPPLSSKHHLREGHKFLAAIQQHPDHQDRLQTWMLVHLMPNATRWWCPQNFWYPSFPLLLC